MRPGVAIFTFRGLVNNDNLTAMNSFLTARGLHETSDRNSGAERRR
jgi:hypothetical protein